MVIKDTSPEDTRPVALCHKKAFPDSLSSKLGTSYCMKMLTWYIEDERGDLFHLEENCRVIGYCGGIKHSVPGKHGSATSVTQYTFKTLVFSFLKKPWLIFHPEIRSRLPFIIKNITLKLKPIKTFMSSPTGNSSQDFIPSIGLVVIGVDPVYQGKGFGSVLLKEFEKRARENGFRRINLSVKKDNKQAITAYQKNGWSIGSTGKEELTMYKTLE